MGEEVLQKLAQKEGDRSKIESDDIQKALKDGFFDNEENTKSIAEKFKNNISELGEQLKKCLEVAYEEINKKTEKTENDTKILALYDKLLPQSADQKTEVIDYGKLPDTGYLEVLSLNIGKSSKDIKKLLVKNVKFADYDEHTIPLISENDISTFLAVDITTYDAQTQDAIVYNIKSILLDRNKYCHDKTNRTNKGSLKTVVGELNVSKKVVVLYEKLSDAKTQKSILAGTLDLHTIEKQYDAYVTDKVFGQIVAELFTENNNDLQKIYKNWAANSPLWNFVKNKAEADLGKQNVYTSLYYNYVQDKVKDSLFTVYVDKKTGEELPIDDKQYETKYKNDGQVIQIQLIKDLTTNAVYDFLETTKYGASLIETSDRYKSQKEQAPLLQENQNSIAKFSNTLAALENAVKAAKTVTDKYDPILHPQLFQTNTHAYYSREGAAQDAQEKYAHAVKQLTIQGNEAFVDMLLNLHDVGLSSQLKPYFDALNGGANYKGKKQLPAPIGGAAFVLDFSKLNLDKIGTNREQYIQDNIDNICRNSGWEQASDAVGQIIQDIKKHPENFLVDVVSIVGAGIVSSAIVTRSGGTAVLASASIFTATQNILKGTGMGVLAKLQGDSFMNAFEEAGGKIKKDPDHEGSYISVGRGDFLVNKSFELGTNIVLFGPTGRVGQVVEKTVLGSFEKNLAREATESMITKLGLEKVGAKTIALFAEAGFFTGFNTVAGVLQSPGSSENYRNEALSPGKLASGFVNNLIFISALKAGNFIATPLQKKIADRNLLKASEKYTKDVFDKNNLLNAEKKNLKDTFNITIEKKINTDGTEIPIWVKNGQEIFENSPGVNLDRYLAIEKQLVSSQTALIQTQTAIVHQTNIFLAEPSVKEYTDFVKQNNLGAETLTPENVIDLRIQYFEKKGSPKDVEIWKNKKAEYQPLQEKYNTKLYEYISKNINSAVQENQQASAIELKANPDISQSNEVKLYSERETIPVETKDPRLSQVAWIENFSVDPQFAHLADKMGVVVDGQLFVNKVIRDTKSLSEKKVFVVHERMHQVMSRLETGQREQVVSELQNNNPSAWNRLAKLVPGDLAAIDIANELVADYVAKKSAGKEVDPYLEKVLGPKEWCNDNIRKINDFIKNNTVNNDIDLAQAAFIFLDTAPRVAESIEILGRDAVKNKLNDNFVTIDKTGNTFDPVLSNPKRTIETLSNEGFTDVQISADKKSITARLGDEVITFQEKPKVRNDFNPDKNGGKAYDLYTKVYKNTFTLENYTGDSFNGIRAILAKGGMKGIKEMEGLLLKIVDNIGIDNFNKQFAINEIVDASGLGQVQEHTFTKNDAHSNQHEIPISLKGKPSAIEKYQQVVGNMEEAMNKLPKDSEIITSDLKADVIKMTQIFVENLLQTSFSGNFTTEKLFQLAQGNVNKMIFQQIANDKLIGGSDHGIKHLISNMKLNGNMIDQLLSTGTIDATQAARLKVMSIQIFVDHDLGYGAKFMGELREGELNPNFLAAINDHPLRSGVFQTINEAEYIALYGEIYHMMHEAMVDHSNVRANVEFNKSMSESEMLKLLISVPDCLAAYRSDKGREGFSNAEMMQLLHKMYLITENVSTIRTPELKQKALNDCKMKMFKVVEEKLAPHDPDKQKLLKNAVEYTIRLRDLGYTIKYNFGSYAGSLNGLFFEKVPSKDTQRMVQKITLYQDAIVAVNNAFGVDIALSTSTKIMDDFGISDKIPKTTIQLSGSPNSEQVTFETPTAFVDFLTKPENVGKTFRVLSDGQKMQFEFTLDAASNNIDVKQTVKYIQRGTEALKTLKTPFFDNFITFESVMRKSPSYYDGSGVADNMKLKYNDLIVCNENIKKIINGRFIVDLSKGSFNYQQIIGDAASFNQHDRQELIRNFGRRTAIIENIKTEHIQNY